MSPSDAYVIEGGMKLNGVVTTNTAKNSAVSLLMGSCVNRKSTILHNVPQIEEVFRIIEVLRSIGMHIEQFERSIKLSPPKTFSFTSINKPAALKTRSAILLAGAASRMNQPYRIPVPGGCKLGSRTIRPHLLALRELGIKILSCEDGLIVSPEARKNADLVMSEAGDVAVENVLFAAASINGKTTIRKVSANYMVQETVLFLQQLGVEIDGIGTSTLTVHGKGAVGKDIEYIIAEDPIESMFFLTAALMTSSSLTIRRCPIDFLELELYKLRQMGFRFDCSERYLAENGFTNLVDITTFPSRLTALEDRIHSLPYPGINADNLPFFAPIACMARGTTKIHDWMYEDRAAYYLLLNKMGADVVLRSRHEAEITGIRTLYSAEVESPMALRPAAVVLLTMLAAKGRSILRNTYPIRRGYEDLAGRLNQLGAKVNLVRQTD
ncbi:MAG: UDP-N-acetylglucosamine 1-carboxyvinyltransferase [Calditrichota bacterium]